MLINWLANKVATHLKRTEREDLKAALADLRSEREAAARDTRQLVQELEDVLEKTQRMFARMAMRRSRELKRDLDGAEVEPPAHEAMAAAAADRPLSPKERKALLRRNLMGGRFRASGGGGDE